MAEAALWGGAKAGLVAAVAKAVVVKAAAVARMEVQQAATRAGSRRRIARDCCTAAGHLGDAGKKLPSGVMMSLPAATKSILLIVGPSMEREAAMGKPPWAAITPLRIGWAFLASASEGSMVLCAL